MREVLIKAVANPAAVPEAFGDPSRVRAGVGEPYAGPDVTILNTIWGPKMTIRRLVTDEGPEAAAAAMGQRHPEYEAVSAIPNPPRPGHCRSG